MSVQASAAATAIEVVKNGPYRVSGTCRVRTARGEDVPVRGRFALCRCGSSANKPFCDGTHAKIGFDGTRFTRARLEDTDAGHARRLLGGGGARACDLLPLVHALSRTARGGYFLAHNSAQAPTAASTSGAEMWRWVTKRRT